jgi:hypothetical protein
MSFSFNPTGLLQNNLITTKIDFINKYGNLSNNYTNLDAIGEQRQLWFYGIVVLSSILGFILFRYSQPTLNVDNKLERTNFEKLLQYGSYLCAIIFLVSLVYSGYMYWGVYLPEYYRWYAKLPIEAKGQLNIIHSINDVANMSYNRYNNNYQQPLIRFG